MNSPPWKEAHARAIEAVADHYTDPQTGYLVFTEVYHLRRGNCCGSACRHCPFEHKNVPRKSQLTPKK